MFRNTMGQNARFFQGHSSTSHASQARSNRTDSSQIATNLAATCNYAALFSGAQQQHRTTNAQARNNVEVRKIRAPVATILAATCNYAALFPKAQLAHRPPDG